MRKPNSTIVLLYIFHIIHPQKQKRSVQPFCFRGEHSKGLSNQADGELDMINAISAVKLKSYCELIECSRPIRFFIVSLMYNTPYRYYYCLKIILKGRHSSRRRNKGRWLTKMSYRGVREICKNSFLEPWCGISILERSCL